MASHFFVTFLFLLLSLTPSVINGATNRLRNTIPSTGLERNINKDNHNEHLAEIHLLVAAKTRLLYNDTTIHPMPKGMPIPPSGPGRRHNNHPPAGNRGH
ncbi:hypothetical protein FRX31_002581 [Thalictrum thalictroides]|uniref:CLAVATA3/ESR (CLE)-related protein n=1 Tax=Thalictrum thalictroides TaxID=46969 RepID=A0A7J6XDK7_THATH|nr:hypothetical protein FRX31_002581 [Thalictrum thalictroides]